MSDYLQPQDLIDDKKHSTFFAEVITGKAGGVAGGSSIDTATNAVTSQVQKTMPKIMVDAESAFDAQLSSQQSEFDAQLQAQGWNPVAGSFETGGTIVNRRDILWWEAAKAWYSWQGALPKVVTAGSTPATAGGVSTTAWVDRTDGALRGDITPFVPEMPFNTGLEAVGAANYNFSSQRNETVILPPAVSSGGIPRISLSSRTNLQLYSTEINCNGLQDYRVLGAVDASDISICGAKIVSDSTAGNDAMSAIFFGTSSGIDVRGLSVLNSYLKDTSWGVLSSAESGAGTMYGVRYTGNFVEALDNSALAADGLHIAGRWIGAAATGNVVISRHDAGVAFNMTGSHRGKGGAISGNAIVDCLVGIDFSGSRFVAESGNSLISDVVTSESNPAWRCITYSGSNPEYVVGGPGIAISNHSSNGEFDTKFDTAGSTVEGLLIGKITKSTYINSKNISINSNHYIAGAGIYCDNGCDNVHILNNTFMGAFDISTPGNAGLGGDIHIGNNSWDKSNPSNFLPNYGKWFKVDGGQYVRCDDEVIAIMSGSFNTSSTAYVDIPNSKFLVQNPCILTRMEVLADCVTHSAYVAVTDLSNNILCEYICNVTPGAGGADVAGIQSLPNLSGNSYMPKLAAGKYKLMAKALVNGVTITSLKVRGWN